MPKKMSLTGAAPKEFPALLNTNRGPVLALEPTAYLAKDGKGFSWFGEPNCMDKWIASQQDREQIVDLIQRLDDVSAFSSIYNEWVPRCLEYSYLVELAGSLSTFWDSATTVRVDEFLDQTFPGLTGYSVDDALHAVKPLQEWPAGRKLGVEKVRFIISSGPVNTGLLSFTTRSIVFHYKSCGNKYAYYIGFKDYEELDTDTVGKYDWYAACWKHLFYQLLAACGIRSDDLMFICADGLPPLENYQFDGKGLIPYRATNHDFVLERLEYALELWRHTKQVY